MAYQVGSSDPPTLISVLMCVHNGENFLAAAIDSVLEQTDQGFEFIVVDDGSTDETAAILGRYRRALTVSTSPTNEGIGRARNRAVAQASGAYLTFFDHDDLLPPQSLAQRRLVLDQHGEAEAVATLVDEYVSSGFEDWLASEGIQPRTALRGALTSMLIRRSAFDRIGAFEDLPTGAGVNWLMRASQQGLAVAQLEQVTYHRRLHDSNNSYRNATNERLRFEAIRLARGPRDGGDSRRSSLG